MRKTKTGTLILLVSALTLSLLAIPAFGQFFGPGPFDASNEDRAINPMQRRMRHPGLRALRALDLTDAQKEQIKAIHERSRTASKQYQERLKPLQEQMQALIHSDSFNETAARTIANQQAAIMTELSIIRARTQAAVYNVLTPDQKAKLAEMRNKRKSENKTEPSTREVKPRRIR